MESEFQVQNIALKTLKQRCEYLQQRLDDLEEENCKLKLEKAQISNSSISKNSSSISSLEEEVIKLRKEKSQMAHQLQMITNENFNLWTQLSKVLPGNEFTAQKLSFSPHLSNHQVFKLNQSDNPISMSASNNITGDFSKESLEEISLKLINGILMSKNELENQYSQMIDLQRENNIDEINMVLPKQYDNRAVTKNMKDYIQKLKDFKQVLCRQKSDLTSVITVMKNLGNISVNRDLINSNNNDNEIIRRSENEFSLPQERRTINGEQSNTEMICPFCGENFTKQFADFYRHVVQHLDEDSDEFLDASSNSEQ